MCFAGMFYILLFVVVVIRQTILTQNMHNINTLKYKVHFMQVVKRQLPN